MLDIKEIRDLSIEDLNQEVDDLKEELFNLRFQQAVGQLDDTARLRSVKKTIARILTVINERSQA
ncbi:MAG: 50S ribosomal protein L29 [Erysipelothrix sp.]|nr:50S ribosomal protein L29 [Erysipelothrix sp.]